MLSGAAEMTNAGAGTAVWFALRIDDNTPGIVDAFPGWGRAQSPPGGPAAAALTATARRPLARPLLINSARFPASKVTA